MTTPGPMLRPTTDAAYILGMTPGGFRAWARRHGITPSEYRPTGGAGHPAAWWDLTRITTAARTQHSSGAAEQASITAA